MALRENRKKIILFPQNNLGLTNSALLIQKKQGGKKNQSEIFIWQQSAGTHSCVGRISFYPQGNGKP